MTASTELDAVRRAAATVPDFFVVGHPKSGTTALYEMLRRDPGVFMPDLKEPWFFAEDMRPRFQPKRTGAVPQTLEQYLALFGAASPGQLLGEATSCYLRSASAAERIAQLRPDARIIAILREPASFLRSLHQQLLRDHVESEQSFRKALSLEDARRQGKAIPRGSHLPQMLLYSDHVRYVEQLRRYRSAFPAEQMLVLIYDDFREDNEGTLRRVQRFLGLPGDAEVQTVEANASDKRMRSQRLDDVVNVVSVGRGPASRAAKAAVKLLSTSSMREQALQITRRKLIFAKPPPPDEQLMAELRERFHGEVAQLGSYLHRDLLSQWGYPAAAPDAPGGRGSSS
jgi:hypothetical protein